MTAECNQFIFGFHPQKRREIRAQFDGGAITSDGGGLLLREVEKRVGILHRFAACFTDYRNPDLIEHQVAEMVAHKASLWSGLGIRRSERSRGVAERSLASGTGGEGRSQQASLSRKEHPESAGTDQRDGQSEGARQKDRAGSWSRGPPTGRGLSASSWSRSRKKSSWTRTRLTIRCTGSRKGVSSMATTDTIATYRCTSSAGSSSCARGCAPQTSMRRQEV